MAKEKQKEKDAGGLGAAATPAAPVAVPKRSPLQSKAVILAVIILVIVLVEIVAAYVIVHSLRKNEEEKMVKEKKEQNKKEDADSRGEDWIDEKAYGQSTEEVELVVNVASTEAERFLKVVFVLEFDNVKYPNLITALGLKKPKVKNIALEVLSTKGMQELLGSTAKLVIRNQIKKEVNKILTDEEGKIRDVLFHEFVIQ